VQTVELESLLVSPAQQLQELAVAVEEITMALEVWVDQVAVETLRTAQQQEQLEQQTPVEAAVERETLEAVETEALA
jgi:hypothetical protein